jgi:ribose transport system ATP-binding protein
LSEIQIVCDRAIVIFGGEVVAEIDADDADEPTLLRAAHNLSSDALLPEEVVAAAIADEAEASAGPTGGQAQ